MKKDSEVYSTDWLYLDRPTRRGSSGYVALAGIYTETHQRLGDIRKEILEQAAEAGMQPPLTRPEIRTGTRHDEIVERLGDLGRGLLDAHAIAMESNLIAMLNLRGENNRIALASNEALVITEPLMLRKVELPI